MIDVSKMTPKEVETLNDYALKTSQLRNFQKVLNEPLPKKKYDGLLPLLSGYIVRQKNAHVKSTPILKKYGITL